jgi:hypothetical protein
VGREQGQSKRGAYIVFLDLDSERLGVLPRSVLGASTKLHGVIERMLLFLAAENVFAAADDGATAVAHVCEPEFVVSQNGKQRRRGSDDALFVGFGDRAFVSALQDLDGVDVIVRQKELVLDVFESSQLERAVCFTSVSLHISP